MTGGLNIWSGSRAAVLHLRESVSLPRNPTIGQVKSIVSGVPFAVISVGGQTQL